MSWDNVAGVSSAQIWTDNPDMTQAWLFANGNHQVKLTIGVSFNLTDKTQPGPTQDEVSAALTLINYQTGAGVSYLKEGVAGGYLASYQPDAAPTVKQIEVTDTGHFQYELDYYLSSDSTINPNYMSESVALLLTYTNKDGQEIEYMTASSSKSQSYVTVTVYPPKKYGMSGSNMTPIIFGVIDDNASFTQIEYNTVVNHLYSTNARIYGLRIDDSYFRLSEYQTVNTPVSPTAFLQHRINDTSDKQDYEYYVAHSFLPVENNLKSTGADYTSKIDFVTENNCFLIEFGVNVHQQLGLLIFIRFACEIRYSDYNNDGPIANSGGKAQLIVFDQFGHSANIEVDNDGDGYLKLTSVT